MVPPLIDKARAIHGEDAAWQAAIRKVAASQVPDFHRDMLRDHHRNALYKEALEWHAKGRTVLDIGTGSGLLAMMAARAGAQHVYACEANPLLAAAALKAIAANDLSNAITVLPSHSTALDAKKDLGGGVDLVVSEIFSDDLLSESMLPSLEHARRELCEPDAIFVPEHAAIEVALAQYDGFQPEATRIEGFDLSAAFDVLPQAAKHHPEHERITPVSASAEAFSFDFTSGKSIPAREMRQIALELTSGTCNAIAQWLEIRFADDLVYENAPGSDRSLHWYVCLSPCGPFDSDQHPHITVTAMRDQVGLALSAQASAKS